MTKFKDMFAKIRAFVARIFGNKESQEAKKVRRKVQQRERKHTGAHYYLTDLLDQVESAFTSLNSMKKVSKNAYRTFSKMSCTVQSRDFVNTEGNAYAITPDQIPSIGCSYIPDDKHNGRLVDEKDEARYPTFCYFKRIKKPVNVQPTNHVVLEIASIYEFKDGPTPLKFYCAIDDNCNVIPLKQLHRDMHQVRPKVSRKGHRAFEVMRTHWALPASVTIMAEKHNMTPEEYAAETVWLAINCCLSVDSGINVRVAKGSDRLTFGIDMLRTPYFFKDREKVVNENGSTKKIFHIVAAHERTLASGEKKIIKSHFRGIRKFMWNGYRVNILLSGKHIKSINSWAIDASEQLSGEIEKGYVEVSSAVAKLSETYDKA